MRMLVAAVALMLLLVTACSESESWRSETATAIGDELAGRLAEPLAQAADTGPDADFDRTGAVVEEALDAMDLPTGVHRVVLGSRQGFTSESGYADVSLPLVVVPTDGGEMFCMAFALSSTGERVAEPVSGDPINRCADSQKIELAGP